MNFKNPNLFVSKESGLPLNIVKPLKRTVPKQLPKEIDADALMQQASSTKNSFTAILIIEIVLSFFLKGIIDDLWGLFLILQIFAYLSIYDM